MANQFVQLARRVARRVARSSSSACSRPCRCSIGALYRYTNIIGVNPFLHHQTISSNKSKVICICHTLFNCCHFVFRFRFPLSRFPAAICILPARLLLANGACPMVELAWLANMSAACAPTAAAAAPRFACSRNICPFEGVKGKLE